MIFEDRIIICLKGDVLINYFSLLICSLDWKIYIKAYFLRFIKLIKEDSKYFFLSWFNVDLILLSRYIYFKQGR